MLLVIVQVDIDMFQKQCGVPMQLVYYYMVLTASRDWPLTDIEMKFF